MIRGLGIDLLEIERVARLMACHRGRFLERVFTPSELGLFAHTPATAHHWAGRLAAKEAVMKALGTGWAAGVSWRQIEVLRDGSGAPQVRLAGRAAERCQEIGGRKIWLSISHSERYVVAQALVEG